MPMVTLAMVVACLLTQSQASEEFQICSLTKGVHLMELPKLQSCKPPDTANARDVKVKILVPRTAPVTVPAFHCTEIISSVCTYSFFGGIISKQLPTVEHRSLNASQCWKLADELTTPDNRTLERLDKDIFRTKSVLTQGRRVFGESCTSTSDFELQSGLVGSMDGLSIISDLTRRNNCSIPQGACEEANSTVVWKVPDPNVFCPYEDAGSFHGFSTPDKLVIESMQASFIRSHDQETDSHTKQCLPDGIVKIENHAFVLYLQDNVHDVGESHQRRKRSTSNRLTFPEKIRAMMTKITAMRALARTPLTKVLNSSAIVELSHQRPNKRQPCCNVTQLVVSENRPKTRESGTENEPLKPRSSTKGTFPYLQPLSFIATYHNGTYAQPRWQYETIQGQIASHISQMPHASLVTFPMNLTRFFVFWDHNQVTMYRKEEWQLHERQRLGQSYTQGRSYRTVAEDEIAVDYSDNDASDGLLTDTQMHSFMQQWERIKERYDAERDINAFIDEREQMDLIMPEDVEPIGLNKVTSASRKKRSGNDTEVQPLENREEERRQAQEEARRFEEAKRARKAAADAAKKAADAARKASSRAPTTPRPPTAPPSPAAEKPSSETRRDTEQWMNELNDRFQFASDKLDEHIRNAFKRMWVQVCEIHNEQVRHMTSLATMDPSLGVRAWLRRSDVYATFVGQVLAVTPCTQVKPDAIFWNRTVDETCYEEVVVRLNNSLWFVQEGTRDLKRNGRKIDCAHRRQSVYKSELGWITDDGHQTHVASLTQRRSNTTRSRLSSKHRPFSILTMQELAQLSRSGVITSIG